MKRTFLRIAVLTLILALCAVSALSEPLSGGWQNVPCEAAELPEDAQAAFDKALDGLVGAQYTPVALLSTQVVAGMNYCVLCKGADADDAYTFLYLYIDLQGNAKLTDAVRFTEGSDNENRD